MIGHVDGNALAGVLSELFRFDGTMAGIRCATCGDLAVLAKAMVYGGEQGLVVRCGVCGDVLMVVVQTLDRTRIHLRGAAWLEVENPGLL